MEKLCILSDFYPSAEDPVYAFVGTLVERFADMGIECHVITPVSLFRKNHRANSRTEMTAKGNPIHVYCPRFLIFPYRKFGRINTFLWTMASKHHAVQRTFRKYIKTCDAFYSHFVATGGLHAALLKKRTGIPAFMALGESSLTRSAYAYEPYRELLLSGFSGVITVSSDLHRQVQQMKLVSETTPVKVFPNSIDTEVFYPRDRAACRARWNLKESDFVVAFVGGYIKRKGFDVLQQVIARHPEWKCILIGAGEEKITLAQEQILFAGRLSHNDVPEYLGAADVFALPTLAEGCCNAIIEAMGCGLPVVSSDRSFNDDILDDSCSVRINPESADALDDALTLLSQDSSLRNCLAQGACKRASSLSIAQRASGIVSFMEAHLD